MNCLGNRSLGFLSLAVATAFLCKPVNAVAADTNDALAPFLRSMGTAEPKIYLALGTNQFEAVLAAAEKGDASAQVFVGDCYSRGSVVTQNAVDAAAWYRKAAERGHLAAQFKLGACLLQSSAGSKDENEGVEWVRKAAERNNVQALSLLGWLYDHGQGGVGTNATEAFRWYRRAADFRDDWARLRLGQFYVEGRGVPRDAVEALKWYELASRDGKRFAEEAREKGAALAAKMSITEVIEARRRVSAYAPNRFLTGSSNSIPESGSFTSLGRTALPAPTGQMTIEAPIELRDNRPIVSIRVNDSKPLRLMFDSGSGISILTTRAASRLKLKTTSTIKLNSEPVGTVEGLAFNLAGASYRPRAVAVHPMKSDRMLDPFLDGVLGADVLDHFVVELDYRAKRIRFRDLAKYKYTGSGVNLFMRFDGSRPYVEATILPQSRPALKGTWLIDTGASDALYVGSEFAERHSLLDAAGTTLGGRSVVLSGTSRTRIGRFKRLHVGHFLVEEPKVTFSETGERDPFGKLSCAIGGEILRRFTVIFHKGRQQLTLEPNGLPPKPTLTGETGSELFN